ncbi:MAG: hypothetical protein RL662_2484 [Bacteroidota bacterium]|jgi:thiosulfate dehydrogenase [quinone] large subunit
MKKTNTYSITQTCWLVALRLAIGWHFLYEGVVKFLNPKWSAYPYLLDSQGLLSDMFHAIAEDPSMLSLVNFINIYGLIAVGLGLMLGCFASMASIGGVIFLTFYYLSHPPFIGATYMLPTEGVYLWVDKTMIEAFALLVLFHFPTSYMIGFDRYIYPFMKSKKQR